MQDLIWDTQPRASIAQLIGTFEGRFDACTLKRFNEATEKIISDVSVHWTIKPIEGVDCAFLWELSWQTSVELRCERCNNTFIKALSADSALGLISHDSDEALIVGRYTEVLLIDEIESLGHVFEDELILALPIVAECNDEKCKLGVISFGQEPMAINPFSVLEKLKLKN